MAGTADSKKVAAARLTASSVDPSSSPHDKVPLMMTKRLRQAVERAASVLEAQEQDALADQLLAKLAKEEKHLTEFVHGIVDTLAQLMDTDNDAKWLALFAEDWDKFERLAEKARAEIAVGMATPFDHDKL